MEGLQVSMYYQFLTHQPILRDISSLVTCKRALVNVDSACLINLKILLFDIISILLRILSLCLYCLYWENFSMIIKGLAFLANFGLLQLHRNLYILDVILNDFH